MDQETGLVLHHVSLADNCNLDKTSDFLTQLHLATGLTEDQVANAEVLKNLNLQDEDSTIKQFVFQGQCLILGDSGAGKTSLVNSLTGKPFDPSQTKTRKMEQKLVDEDWKNLGLKNLLFGNLWWFCHRIRVQLTLYGPARSQNIFLRVLNDWRNLFLEVNTMGPIHRICVVGLCYLIFGLIVKTPLISPLLLLIVLLYIVFLYLLHYNYTFRLIVTIFAFTVRTQGLLIGAFSALTLVCYRYGKISLGVDGCLLILLTWGLVIVVLTLSGLGITWRCPHPRQMKFKYQRSLTIACFMPFLLSVLVGLVTFSALAILLINYWTGLGLSIKNPDVFVQLLVSVFGFWWTVELLKSAYSYIKIILLKWLSRDIFKVAVAACTLMIAVYTYLLTRLIDMCCYLSFDSAIFLIFLCDSLFREQLNMQELGIEGNMFTLVVIEKQELQTKQLKIALHEKFSSIEFRILDFPGDKEYHPYYQIFLRKKAFYVIVFNMANFAENDFNGIDSKCNRLQFWFETLCSHVPPNPPIFLVGTQRGDMDRNNIKRLDEHLRNCLWNTYCDELVVNDTEDLVFFPIENSKGKEESGVRVLQEQITTVAQNFKESFGCEIPLSWVRVQDAIISLKAKKKGAKFCLHLEEFSNVVENFDNFCSTNWSTEILQYFHETGLVIYLERDQDLDLSKWILLKPEILVDIIILLITPSPQMTQERGLRHDWNLLQKKGLLTKSLLKNIISKVKESVEAMTAFLEEYDLIFPLANCKVNMCRVQEGEEQPTHFVPSLLPMALERDTPIWHDDDTDKKCYVFFTKFLPEPLFHHLLSRAHKLSRVEFPNGHTVLFRDAGKFWLSAWQPYNLKLMREEKMIEVTFSCG